jgi:hypothetical protein
MRALPPTKKLIATIALLIWLPLYALAAMRVGVAVLPEGGTAVHLILCPGRLAWILPVGSCCWMHHANRPSAAKDARSG